MSTIKRVYSGIYANLPYMESVVDESGNSQQTRREFIKTGAVVTGAMAAPFILSSRGYAVPKTDTIKIGLIGCGGRGTSAAMQALHADPNVVLVAMGDVFQTQIDNSIKAIKSDTAIASRVRVTPAMSFVGLDCYEKVIGTDIDVVLLASPPGFRPREVITAVKAGKHVFAEKPVATDAAGVRTALEAAAIAKEKKTSLVAGLCWRYDAARRAFYKRIHDGAVGSVRYVHATYLTGPVRPMPPASDRPAGMSDVEWQIRNWYNFVWLSGDGLVEQAVHSVDKIMWAMKDVPPLKCTATGGRNNPNNEGNIFDHIDVFYEWADGTRATMAQRQIAGCMGDNSDWVNGSTGIGTISGAVSIKGAQNWAWEGPVKNMYQVEHDELFASIRSGKPINDGIRMAHSTLAGLMGRMAAYTGQEVTWEQAMNSQDKLFPENLTWDMKLPIAPMAKPGVTKLL